jgi:hypothetical protein
VTDRRIPLGEHALDRLMLATDEAVTAYQEQRLKLQAAREARDDRQRADLADNRAGGDDEIA